MTGPERTLLLALASLAIESADAATSERLAQLAEAAHPGFEDSIRVETMARINRVRRTHHRQVRAAVAFVQRGLRRKGQTTGGDR